MQRALIMRQKYKSCSLGFFISLAWIELHTIESKLYMAVSMWRNMLESFLVVNKLVKLKQFAESWFFRIEHKLFSSMISLVHYGENVETPSKLIVLYFRFSNLFRQLFHLYLQVFAVSGGWDNEHSYF